jgi:hypothetical protein
VTSIVEGPAPGVPAGASTFMSATKLDFDVTSAA